MRKAGCPAGPPTGFDSWNRLVCSTFTPGINRSSSIARWSRLLRGPRFEPHPTRQRAMLTTQGFQGTPRFPSTPTPGSRGAVFTSAGPSQEVSTPTIAARFYRARLAIDHIRPPEFQNHQTRPAGSSSRSIFNRSNHARSGGTSRPRPKVVDYRSLSRRPPKTRACCCCFVPLHSRERPCSPVYRTFHAFLKTPRESFALRQAVIQGVV